MMAQRGLAVRRKSVRKVNSALTEFGPLIVRSLNELFGAGTGEAMAVALERMEQGISLSEQRLVQAVTAHDQEKSESDPARKTRDAADVHLRGELVEVREVLSGIFGADAVNLLGFEGRTPQDANEALVVARKVAGALLHWKHPPPRLPGYHFDSAPWIARLTTAADALEQALVTMSREERQTQVTQVAKDEAQARHDKLFGAIATLTSALLQLSGQPKLAREVRESRSRPGVAAGLEEEAQLEEEQTAPTPEAVKTTA